jgi:hypothetical protein
MAPPPVNRAFASTAVAAANASPARYAVSWKSAIIMCCCSCVGWVQRISTISKVFLRISKVFLHF